MLQWVKENDVVYGLMLKALLAEFARNKMWEWLDFELALDSESLIALFLLSLFLPLSFSLSLSLALSLSLSLSFPYFMNSLTLGMR